MANYTSHAIMSELLFNKLNDKNKFKIKINKNNMKLFSFGQDLTVSDSECFHDTHKINSKLFFINTIKYISENNLQYNSDIMAYLYGHIAHYALDTVIHNFVNNMVDGIDKKAFLTPHTLLECNLDRCLMAKYHDNTDYLNLKPLKNNQLRAMINTTYANVYGYFNASSNYFKSILFISKSNAVVNFLYRNLNIFDLFAKKARYQDEAYFYNCLNKDNYLDQKYLKLLNEAINKAERMIKYTNKYLYDRSNELYLNLVFNNAPYNGKEITKLGSILNKLPIFNEIKIK